MTELLSIDVRIHNLEAEIDGSNSLLAPPHHLAVKYDTLVGLYIRKSEVTRQPEDNEAATRSNTLAIQAGRLALAPDQLGVLDKDEVGRRWCFQGARLAWRSKVVGDHGTGSGMGILTSIDSEALDEAIAAYDIALAELPSHRSSLRQEVAHNRMNLLGARFDLKGFRTDIDEAISSGDVALAIPHSAMAPAVCNDVGVLYQQRGRLQSSLADLQRAVELGLMSLTDQDPSDRIRVERVLNLYASRKQLFELTGQIQELEEARKELLAVLNLDEHGPGHKRSHILVRLASLAHLLAAVTGSAVYQAEAIRFAQEGLAIARTDEISDEHAELIWILANILSETDAQDRSAEELAAILREGGDPL